jgi:hypothetical protein
VGAQLDQQTGTSVKGLAEQGDFLSFQELAFVSNVNRKATSVESFLIEQLICVQIAVNNWFALVKNETMLEQ